MLQFIMITLCKADPEMAAIFREENKCWTTKCTDWDTVNKKYNDTNSSYMSAAGSLKAV